MMPWITSWFVFLNHFVMNDVILMTKILTKARLIVMTVLLSILSIKIFLRSSYVTFCAGPNISWLRSYIVSLQKTLNVWLFNMIFTHDELWQIKMLELKTMLKGMILSINNLYFILSLCVSSSMANTVWIIWLGLAIDRIEFHFEMTQTTMKCYFASLELYHY